MFFPLAKTSTVLCADADCDGQLLDPHGGAFRHDDWAGYLGGIEGNSSSGSRCFAAADRRLRTRECKDGSFGVAFCRVDCESGEGRLDRETDGWTLLHTYCSIVAYFEDATVSRGKVIYNT